MQSKVLTQKQKKKTLSFKHQRRKVVRNVYSTPYDKYWPLLDESTEEACSELMEKAFSAAHLPTIKKKWHWKKNKKQSKYKNAEMTSAKRCKDNDNDVVNIECDEDDDGNNDDKDARTSYQEAMKSAKAVRSDFVFGINMACRALEKSELSVMVLANDIDPPMLSQHIADLCVVKQVPLLVMKTLREKTCSHLGFSCIAFGIKSNPKHSAELEAKLINCSAMYPLPTDPALQGAAEGDSDKSLNANQDKVDQEKWDPSKLNDIYLIRKSKKERVFVPHLSHPNLLTEKPKFEGDYISLISSSEQGGRQMPAPKGQAGSKTYYATTTLGLHQPPRDVIAGVSLPKRQKLSNYKSLVVKVIQSNPNKKKEKRKLKRRQYR